jgi:adenine-specific DNA-methyltransferase
LQALLYPYEGKVDAIYIDPPYNTGAKDWKYNNDYVCKDDQYRHSKWLTFMEDRLKLAKKLLNPNRSALICAIDEKEFLRLGMLLEQLFPEAKIEMVTSVISGKGVARSGHFSRVEEHLFYVLIGDASISLGAENMLDDTRNSSETIGKDVDWLGLRRREPSAVRGARKDQFYPIYVDIDEKRIVKIGDSIPDDFDKNTIVPPDGCEVIWPIRSNGKDGIWGITPTTARRNLEKGYIRASFTTRKGNAIITIKYLPEGTVNGIESGGIAVVGRNEDGSVVCRYEEAKGVIPKRVWNRKSHNSETYGSLLIGALLPDRAFSYPKSLYAVEDALRYLVGNNKNALVVDFFAGSGTTSHAVMRLNHQDGGRRRSICITNNEISDEEEEAKSKTGLRKGDVDWEKTGICEYITKPRITSAITGRTPEGSIVEGSYRFKDEFLISDGFEENAVFYDLEYLEPSVISADMAYEDIAPLLWMCGGCRGEVLENNGTYQIGETYAVLFDPRYMRQFVEAVKPNDQLRAVFIVTDDSERYRSLCSKLKHHNVRQLYSSYLRNFEINAIG